MRSTPLRVFTRASLSRWVLVSVLCLCSAGAYGSTALAHHGDGSRIPGFPDQKRYGKTTVRYDAASETYRVKREGRPTLATHVDAVGAADPGAHQPLPPNTDPPICASSGHRIKLVYSDVVGSHNPSAPTVAAILDAVQKMNWKIRNESMISSDNAVPLEMKVDCHPDGTPKVFALGVNSGDPFAINGEAKSQLGDPSGAGAVKYLIFRRGWSTGNFGGFGFGYIGAPLATNQTSESGSDLLSTGNPNRLYTESAIIWDHAQQEPGTQPSYWGMQTTIHELFHTLGSSQLNAPFANSGHCTDGLDILCYGDGYTESRCPANGYYNTPAFVSLDCGYDTYFDARAELGEYLSNNWNAGGIEDPYLVEEESSGQSAGVDVTSSASGRLDLVAVAPDGTLRYRSRTGSTWSSWTNLGGKAFPSTVKLVSRAPGKLDLFVRSEEAAIAHRSYVEGSGWDSWESLGGVVRADFDVIADAGSLDVYVRAVDNAVYHSSKTGTAPWTGWQSLGGGITTGLDVVLSPARKVHVFARGGDNALWTRFWSESDGAWSGWHSVGGGFSRTPEAVVSGVTGSPAPHTVHAFIRGGDNNVYSRQLELSATPAFSDLSVWRPLGGGFNNHGGGIASGIEAIERGLNVVDLYARSPSGLIQVKRDALSGSSWVSLGGDFQPETPQVASTGTGSTRPTDVAAVGTDLKVHVGTYTSAGWQGWQQLSWPSDIGS
jgi:hypothetical protein